MKVTQYDNTSQGFDIVYNSKDRTVTVDSAHIAGIDLDVAVQHVESMLFILQEFQLDSLAEGNENTSESS